MIVIIENLLTKSEQNILRVGLLQHHLAQVVKSAAHDEPICSFMEETNVK